MSQASVKALLDDFCQVHRLPPTYAEDAHQTFTPLLNWLHDSLQQSQTPLVVGINGAQGTGKSTLGDLLVCAAHELWQMQAVCLSIDDLYLGKAERQQLARDVHPLLATRGVPGTHDLELATDLFNQLLNNVPGTLAIPRFDKTRDDRQPEADWPVIDTPLQLVVLEGWCVGCVCQPDGRLQPALNDLERQEDSDGRWREFVNHSLQRYQDELWPLMDCLVMLKAPGFDQVFHWRTRQEQKLVERTGIATELSSPAAMQRFISHYQRLTEWMLEEMPDRADWLFELDAQQRIQLAKAPAKSAES